MRPRSRSTAAATGRLLPGDCRVRQLAGALQTLGVGPGDRVATLACSTHRHVEVFFAVSGIGAVCHTVNPRLHSDQFAWILNHAADALMFVDLAFPREPRRRSVDLNACATSS